MSLLPHACQETSTESVRARISISSKNAPSTTAKSTKEVSERSSKPNNSEPSKLSVLETIDEELRDIHRHCLERGYDPKLIQRGSDVLWSRLKPFQRWRRFKKCLVIFFACVAILFLLQVNFINRPLCAYMRIGMIKTLPIWDWTIFYRSSCLIENPYFEPVEVPLMEEDCKVCQDMGKIERLVNVSQGIMAEQYVRMDRPVIVLDAVIDWPANRLFNVDFLRELYVHDEVLKRIPPCVFASSEHFGSGSVKALLNKAAKHEISQYYAHWENCEKTAVRLLRQFFRRPYFLPPMVEAANRNWFIISSQFSADKYRPMDLATPLMWLAQLKGENKIKLEPREPCNTSCNVMYTVLHEGEILVWTDLLWLVDYMPLNTGPRLNIAILFGGYFD